MNKVLIALLSGIIIGILIAPEKGSATREKLIDGFNDLADKFEGLKEEFITQHNEEMNMPEGSVPAMSSQS